MRNKILLIGNKQDIHADCIVDNCQQKNKKIIRLNTEDFRKNNIIVNLKQGHIIFETLGNLAVRPDEIRSVFVRRISPFNCEDVHDDYKKFVSDETKEVLNSMEFLLSGSKWMDKISVREKASNKINQLLAAKKCGLKIPETLITNNISELQDFLKSRSVIYKTMFIPAIDFVGQGTGIINTSPITEDRLPDVFSTLPTAPCMFQVYQEKKFELRIHAIGDKIIAIKIDSQKIDEAKIDWRRADFKKLDYSAFLLPTNVEKKLLQLMKILDINFGIIDMIVTPSDDYIFLEINPNGNWLWIERAIGANISGAITEWLCS